MFGLLIKIVCFKSKNETFPIKFDIIRIEHSEGEKATASSSFQELKNNLDQFKLSEFSTNVDSAFKPSANDAESLCSNNLKQARQVNMDFLRVKFKSASNSAASSLQSTLSKYRPIKKKEELASGGLLQPANRQNSSLLASSSQIEIQRTDSNESVSNSNDDEELRRPSASGSIGALEDAENNHAEQIVSP